VREEGVEIHAKAHRREKNPTSLPVREEGVEIINSCDDLTPILSLPVREEGVEIRKLGQGEVRHGLFPCGKRGLKYTAVLVVGAAVVSLPVREEGVEIKCWLRQKKAHPSLFPCGKRGLKCPRIGFCDVLLMSLPVREEGVEMRMMPIPGRAWRSLPVREEGVEILAFLCCVSTVIVSSRAGRGG